MGLPGRNIETGKMLVGKVRAARYPSTKQSTRPTTSNRSTFLIKGETASPQRLSPVREDNRSPQGSVSSSACTSPGLLAGHYAGCKFSEPPLPSALPLPPRHWMQSPRTVMRPFHIPKTDRCDFEQHLKVLLKVQA